MEQLNTMSFIKEVLNVMPQDWLRLTTHRLDIYNEEQAKAEFLEGIDRLYHQGDFEPKELAELPTSYDYIRLGHPLSCLLEWGIALRNELDWQSVISFSSQTTPILAILRKNHLAGNRTLVTYQDSMPEHFETEVVQEVYGYHFELKKAQDGDNFSGFDGSVISVIDVEDVAQIDLSVINGEVDFVVCKMSNLGSILLVANEKNDHYIPDIQHVRRRETIAMTPINCLKALRTLVNLHNEEEKTNVVQSKQKVLDTISRITGASTKAIVGSSGLSIQYAIMMGLIHYAKDNYTEKAIKIIVPPNCYGGTNDQARRVAACLDNVEVVDLPVDGGNDMVNGVNQVLDQVADQDAVPYIIAEIPTNPRVEVPDLEKLQEALARERKTSAGEVAVEPVFILDQTFCPNVHFLGEGEILSKVRTISYASGSKFPSGGKVTAGYCVANQMAAPLMARIEQHLLLCDNEATDYQYRTLAEQLPSMNQRIIDAYKNTREFVNFIEEHLPEAKINFVSEELAEQGFTPSVFSLDLPTKGSTEEERESYKRALNHKLIHMMITKIPDESKYCVSYGQLKGCYWTIPATSTQGTTKEGDKDYIARVALSASMDLDLHKQVFLQFVEGIKT